jgi:Uncharacterised nucleotidyltransferase
MSTGANPVSEAVLDFPDEQLWHAVGELLDRAPTAADLRAHRLHLLSARRLRLQGRPVSNELAVAERVAGAVTLAAEITLERARAAYDGTLVLMKGLEAAQRYPSPTLRPFRDVDLLVDRPWEAQRALIAAGFQPVGMEDRFYQDKQHLRPLRLPGLPVLVEIHRRPEWVSWAPPPSTAELLSEAVGSATGIDGVQALSPAHHALVLAAHSWSGTPFRRILDLVDTSLLAREADPVALSDAARRWHVDGVWRSMRAAADTVLFGQRAPWHMRLWAGDLRATRDRTVLRDHVVRLLSAFSALPPQRAFAEAGRAVARDLRPGPGETWAVKVGKARRALRNASEQLSLHENPSQEAML